MPDAVGRCRPQICTCTVPHAQLRRHCKHGACKAVSALVPCWCGRCAVRVARSCLLGTIVAVAYGITDGKLFGLSLCTFPGVCHHSAVLRFYSSTVTVLQLYCSVGCHQSVSGAVHFNLQATSLHTAGYTAAALLDRAALCMCGCTLSALEK